MTSFDFQDFLHFGPNSLTPIVHTNQVLRILSQKQISAVFPFWGKFLTKIFICLNVLHYATLPGHFEMLGPGVCTKPIDVFHYIKTVNW